MKHRYLELLTENEIGVLAHIGGLFSGKLCNIDRLHVAPTNDPAVSRIAIAFACGDAVFDQLRRQLQNIVEVVRVTELTDYRP